MFVYGRGLVVQSGALSPDARTLRSRLHTVFLCPGAGFLRPGDAPGCGGHAHRRAAEQVPRPLLARLPPRALGEFAVLLSSLDVNFLARDDPMFFEQAVKRGSRDLEIVRGHFDIAMAQLEGLANGVRLRSVPDLFQ